jgi:hypothetical protein
MQTHEGCDGAFDAGRIVHACRSHLQPKRWAGRFCSVEHCDVGGGLRVHENYRARDGRRNLLEQFHSFATGRRLKVRKARYGTARSCQTLYETAANGVGDLHEHDRDRASCLKNSNEPWIALCEDDIRRECDQLRCVAAQALVISPREAVLDVDVASFSPAKLGEALFERDDANLQLRSF